MLFCKYEVSQTNPSIQQRNVRYMFLLLKHSFLLKTTDLWLRDYAWMFSTAIFKTPSIVHILVLRFLPHTHTNTKRSPVRLLSPCCLAGVCPAAPSAAPPSAPSPVRSPSAEPRAGEGDTPHHAAGHSVSAAGPDPHPPQATRPPSEHHVTGSGSDAGGRSRAGWGWRWMKRSRRRMSSRHAYTAPGWSPVWLPLPGGRWDF